MVLSPFELVDPLGLERLDFSDEAHTLAPTAAAAAVTRVVAPTAVATVNPRVVSNTSIFPHQLGSRPASHSAAQGALRFATGD